MFFYFNLSALFHSQHLTLESNSNIITLVLTACKWAKFEIQFWIQLKSNISWVTTPNRYLNLIIASTTLAIQERFNCRLTLKFQKISYTTIECYTTNEWASKILCKIRCVLKKECDHQIGGSLLGPWKLNLSQTLSFLLKRRTTFSKINLTGYKFKFASLNVERETGW